MARLNSKTATAGSSKSAAKGVIKTTNERVINGEGAIGFKRDARGELFLTAVSSMNEDTFYETASDRQRRITDLVGQVYEDADWIEGLVGWLRESAGLRSIPSVIAVEAVHARLANGQHGRNREIIRAAIGRLDESADLLAFWISRFGNRNIPSAVKRGIADSLNDKLNESSFLKWRGRASNGTVSLRDVLNITRSKPKNQKQSDLYKAVIESAYGRTINDENLPVIRARREFLALSTDQQIQALSGSNADKVINDARLTHEVIAGAIGKIPASVWENLVPNMGFTALRMNLRRISQSNVSIKTIDKINAILRDEEVVSKSKTMPVQFLSAYKNAPLDFSASLQRGANGVLQNVPELTGRTLILVDNSGSMGALMSSKSTMTLSDTANIFAVALGLKLKKADIVSFNGYTERVKLKSKDLLVAVTEMPRAGGFTDTFNAIQTSYKKHDRIILLTDEQHSSFYQDDLFENVPSNVPTYTWNLAGYESASAAKGPLRYTFGGLTDFGFKMIPMLEAGIDQNWPWEE